MVQNVHLIFIEWRIVRNEKKLLKRYLSNQKNQFNRKIQMILFIICQSIDIFMRLEGHFTSPNGQEIDRAIAKNGIKNFDCSILDIAESSKDRNRLEKEWIKTYSNKYGENKLYNRTEGGKDANIKINKDREIIPKEIKTKIFNIFNECIDFPIYLIAEKFNLHFSNVINIRKSALRCHGMHYDMFKRRCVITKTREIPEIWRAGQYTQHQINLFLEFKDILELETLSEKLNSSVADLRDFEKEYSDSYLPAERCMSKKELQLLELPQK